MVGIIKDLRAEKELYENEYNNLLNNQFSKEREREFVNELDILRNANAELEREIQQYIKEKSNLLNKIKELTGIYTSILMRARKLGSNATRQRL